MKVIASVNAPSRTDLPVLHSFQSKYRAPGSLGFSHWLTSISPWVLIALLILACTYPAVVSAQSSGYTFTDAVQALFKWIPFLVTKGFAFTILISFLTMALGTAMGVLLGLGRFTRNRFIDRLCWFTTQIFRNSPWLVLLFIVMLTLPFEIVIGETIIDVPGWIKAVFGLSLPIMANVAEVLRGAVNSVPSGQWEAAESLAFTRRQTLFRIILPQCFKRMIPPWMNWYAILTMATPLVSILGVEEMLNLTVQAIEAENNRPELLVPFYGFALMIFFAYCYPIAKFTLHLEKKYAVEL